MAIKFEYDPDTGLTTHFDYDPIKDEVTLSYTQDVSGFLERMQQLRNNEDYSKKGIKEEWWHYCSIPAVVEIELRNKGLKLENKDHLKDILKEVNSYYSKLKATDKHHA